MSVEDILTAIQALPPDERWRLRVELDHRLSAEEDAKAQTFREALLASGLVTKFKAPRTGRTSRPRRLIEVEGKPISETIIEERR